MHARILSAPFDPEFISLYHHSTGKSACEARDEAIVETLRLGSAVPMPPDDYRTTLRRVRAVLGAMGPFELLAKLARMFVTERDGVPAFRYWNHPHQDQGTDWATMLSGHEKVQLWRDLCLRMEVTPILAASFLDHCLSPDHPAVDLELPMVLADDAVSRILARGLADTHLHLSSAWAFRGAWSQLLDPLSKLLPATVGALAKSTKKGTFPTARLRFSALQALAGALLLRELLLNWPSWGESSELKGGPPGYAERVQETYLALCITDDDPCNLLQRLTAADARMYFDHSQRWLAEKPPACDPRFRDRRRVRLNETAFLLEQLREIGGSTSGRPAPGAAGYRTRRARFLQLYLQLKNAIYRHSVEEKAFPGFWQFEQSFERAKLIDVPSILCVREMTRDPAMRALEVRIRPESRRFTGLRDKLLELLMVQHELLLPPGVGCRNAGNVRSGSAPEAAGRGAPACPLRSRFVAAARGLLPGGFEDSECVLRDARALLFPAPSSLSACEPDAADQIDPYLTLHSATKLGVVAHFTKPRPEAVAKKEEVRQDHSKLAILLEFVEPYLKAALQIWDMLDQVPSLGAYLVGLDVANTETALPGFAFYPPLCILREAWRPAGGRDLRQSLGLTFHAGEEFYDLLSALRSMDELLDLLNMRPGDRLGHGFAAGIDVDWWCAQHEPSVVTTEERVLDLLWEWRLFQLGRFEVSQLPAHESRFRRLAGRWLRRSHETLDLPALQRAMELRHELFLTSALDRFAGILGAGLVERERERQRRRLGDGQADLLAQAALDKCPTQEPLWASYLRSYFHDPDVRREGRKDLLVVHDEESRGRLRGAQQYLCRRIADIGVVVEANLSSNYVIRKLDRLSRHPLYRWSTPGDPLEIPSKVSVNTDNPAIFATTLESEFTLVYHGAIESGRSHQDAMDLIERLRQTNLDSTFIRRRFASREEEIDHLCQTIGVLVTVRSRFPHER